MAKRDWITKDFGWKLFSLILAVASWVVIHRNIVETQFTGLPSVVTLPFGTAKTITFTNVQVSAVSTSADVHNAQVTPNAVAVTLSGPSEIMSVLERNKIHAEVNLTGINSASDLRLPVDVSITSPGVAVDQVDPPKVGVTFAPPTE
jgi:YbbR-like protein